MKGGTRATVKVGGYQRERRFARGTPARIIKAWKTDQRAKLAKRYPLNPEHKGKTGTLAKDAERYYPLIKHLADWVTRRSEIRAWMNAGLADSYRHLITRDDVQRIRGQWVEAGVAAKTINNRVTALRNLYVVLDGKETITPCHGIALLVPVKLPPQVISADVVNAVCVRLAACSYAAAPKDRARLMVLATTGRRPCEVGRAVPADVDMRRRVWVVRDAKGGVSPGAYLNDEMLAAWEAFIEADAWGSYSTSMFAKRLRRRGWPASVRPYNLRHSTWIAASELGADLSDIQAGAGHALLSTTRKHYVPVLNSRMQRLSELLDNRFGWQPRLAGQSESA